MTTPLVDRRRRYASIADGTTSVALRNDRGQGLCRHVRGLAAWGIAMFREGGRRCRFHALNSLTVDADRRDPQRRLARSLSAMGMRSPLEEKVSPWAW